MRHCIIVVGGYINDIFAKEFIEKERPELCIAADSGMNFFYRNKLTPDWIIGDFDSASSEALDYFGGQPDISWIRLNPVKDDTDTESAIRKAIVLGAEKITLLGATGTRIDHLLGNIELLGIGLQNLIPTRLWTRETERHDRGGNHAREGKTVWKVCIPDPLYQCRKRSYADRFQVSSGSL